MPRLIHGAFGPGQPCWKAKRDAEAEPWCIRPGQPCWKAKRAALALSDSISTSGGLAARTPEDGFSNLPGGAAYVAKRSLNDLANLVALAENDPESFYSQLELDNQLPHDSDEGEETPEGDDSTEGDDKTKRDATPEPWCIRPGQPCWKRDPQPDADPADKDKRWCIRPGQPCWKAKRAAEAVLEAVGDSDETAEYDPAYFSKRSAEPWCIRPGQPCWKRSAEAGENLEEKRWCIRPGQPCWKAKRDIMAVRAAANDILKSLE
ncbi:hypothetical protein G7046_g4278 [Stylonectria norvegica]|nr:hypothetical protein G7046_g4278 [Stylonectria norvegica]